MENKSNNAVDLVKNISESMRRIESSYFEANKKLSVLDARQNDLLHVLELELTEEEVVKVATALQEVRNERREAKDLMYSMEEAKNFVALNQKFLVEAENLVGNVGRAIERSEARKYAIRDCQSISGIIEIAKYDRLRLKETDEGKKSEKPISAVEKFNKRASKKQTKTN